MYDAKNHDGKNNNKKIQYTCIATRNYFDRNPNCNVINVKTSHVPIENIFD